MELAEYAIAIPPYALPCGDADHLDEEGQRRKVTVAGERPRARTRFEGDGDGGQSTKVMRKPASRVGLVREGPIVFGADIPSLSDFLK